MSIHAPLVMSYGKQVLGVKKILSIATRLESTSVIIASGIDLFSTKRTPSKPFDTLSTDFSYFQLCLSIFILTAGVFYTNNAVEKKRLRDAWV